MQKTTCKTSHASFDASRALVSKRNSTSVVWTYFGFKQEDAWHSGIVQNVPRYRSYSTRQHHRPVLAFKKASKAVYDDHPARITDWNVQERKSIWTRLKTDTGSGVEICSFLYFWTLVCVICYCNWLDSWIKIYSHQFMHQFIECHPNTQGGMWCKIKEINRNPQPKWCEKYRKSCHIV